MIAETELFDRIESDLDKKLTKDEFTITETRYFEITFGSRYTIWKNEKRKFAVRLSWDGKESWYIVEESPYSKESEPISWADLVIVPFDKSKSTQEYLTEIAQAVVDEIE